jgi:glycosyltransferase involved in cell wall biosynthesis
MPKVSVIVPNYNHQRYLKDRLESIFAQTFTDYELILLDDGSTDGSRDLLQGYARHEKVAAIVLSEHNAGPFAQWGNGVQRARGEYTWIAESDDFAHPTFLQELVAVLEARPQVGIAYCQSQVTDGQGRPLFDNRRWTNDLDPDLWSAPFQMPGKRALREFFIFKNVIPNASAVLFRTNLFPLAGSEIARFRYAGDWLAWSRLSRSCEIYFTPLTLNSFRQHAQTTRVGRSRAQSARYLAEVYEIVSEIVLREGIDPRQRQEVFERLAVKTYVEIGVRHLVERESLRIVWRLSAYDARLAVRLVSLAVRGARRRVFGS